MKLADVGTAAGALGTVGAALTTVGTAAGVVGLVVLSALGLLLVLYLAVAVASLWAPPEKHDQMMDVLDRLTAFVTALRGGQGTKE